MVQYWTSIYNLFGDKDLNAEFKKWRRSVESNFTKCLLEAYEGNTINLWYVGDHYYSENKSAIWTLFGLLSTDEYEISQFTKSSKNSKIFNAKLFRETMRFYEKVFSHFVTDPKVIDLMYKDEMHIFLMLWLSQDLKLILNFIDLNKHFKFLEQNILILIHQLWSSDASIPNLTPLFIKCKDSLEKTYKVNLNQDQNKFLFKAKNFESSNIEILNKAKDLFEPLMQYDANSIIDKDKLAELKDEYDFQILDNGIKLSAPNLLKLVFKALKNDSDATNDIVAIVSPLLRKLPGGIALYKIMSNLSKNNLEKTMSVMPTLVRIMLLTKFDFNPNITEAEIKERIEQLKFTEPLINGVVAWINSLILLINKSTTQIDMSLFQNVFLKMMSCLEKIRKRRYIKCKDSLQSDMAGKVYADDTRTLKKELRNDPHICKRNGLLRCKGQRTLLNFCEVQRHYIQKRRYWSATY